jgi:CubicO group peptidase (beta-lactamase class C family)
MGAALSRERLARIDRLLQEYTDQNRIPGAVALVLRDGMPVYERTFGWSDKEAGQRMSTSTLFRIASQTKAITSAAILMLVEEGKIEINEPVGNFISTFKETTVAVKDDSGVKTVPAKRPITIHDLLTHTAGISYGTESHVAALYQAKGLGPAAGNGWYTADKDEPICETMARLWRAWARSPSSRSLARRMYTATTPISLGVSLRRHPVCHSMNFSGPASQGLWE